MGQYDNGIMNPAFRNNFLKIAENVKNKQQEFTTVAPGADEPFFPENFASNIAAIDRLERAKDRLSKITDIFGR